MLADHLARKGIAVLRVDDRGVGKSTGNLDGTTADFANDVEAGVDFLKTQARIDGGRIGLMGHSEGGTIAPFVASRRSDVSFIVLLAGTGLPGAELLVLQSELLNRSAGKSAEEIARATSINRRIYTIVQGDGDEATMSKQVRTILLESMGPESGPQKLDQAGLEALVKVQTDAMLSPWMRHFLSYDPRPALARVSCPILGLFGQKDMQVPAKPNMAAIRKALHASLNKDITLQELHHLNNMFQTCQIGSPAEYAAIQETIAPSALDLITAWIRRRVGK